VAGRPSKYKPEYVEQAELLCAEFGADDKGLAKFFGVTKTTITNWKNDHPEFLASIKAGKDYHDTGKVEKSLLQRALGYKYTEKTVEAIKTKNEGLVGAKVVKVVEKEMAPDTTAQIFWLTNRQPERWRHVKRLEVVDGDLNRAIEDELAKLAADRKAEATDEAAGTTQH